MTIGLILLIYSVLILAVMAKFYFYYGIRGATLLLSVLTPVLLLIVMPLIITFHIIRNHEIGFITKVISSGRALLDCSIDFPIHVGMAAVCLNPPCQLNAAAGVGGSNASGNWWSNVIAVFDAPVHRMLNCLVKPTGG